MKNSRKMFILTEGILAILAVIAAFVMFQERNGQERPKVSVIIRDSDASRWSAFKYGLEMAAEDMDVEMFVVSTGEQMTLEEEEELIERELNDGVDAMIIQPVSGAQSKEILEQAGKKVPLMLGEQRASSGGKGLPVTEPDHFAMGKTLASELLKDYDGNLLGKTLGIVWSEENSEAARQRAEGFQSELEGEGARVLWTLCEESAKVPLEDQPEADVIVALDDKSFVRAGNASESHTLHGAVVYGIGNSTEAVYCLDFGSAECLIVPDEFSVGYESLRTVAESFRFFSGEMEGKKVSHTVMRRENIFTKENQEILFTMNQ